MISCLVSQGCHTVKPHVQPGDSYPAATQQLAMAPLSREVTTVGVLGMPHNIDPRSLKIIQVHLKIQREH